MAASASLGEAAAVGPVEENGEEEEMATIEDVERKRLTIVVVLILLWEMQLILDLKKDGEHIGDH